MSASASRGLLSKDAAEKFHQGILHIYLNCSNYYKKSVRLIDRCFCLYLQSHSSKQPLTFDEEQELSQNKENFIVLCQKLMDPVFKDEVSVSGLNHELIASVINAIEFNTKIQLDSKEGDQFFEKRMRERQEKLLLSNQMQAGWQPRRVVRGKVEESQDKITSALSIIKGQHDDLKKIWGDHQAALFLLFEIDVEYRDDSRLLFNNVLDYILKSLCDAVNDKLSKIDVNDIQSHAESHVDTLMHAMNKLQEFSIQNKTIEEKLKETIQNLFLNLYQLLDKIFKVKGLDDHIKHFIKVSMDFGLEPLFEQACDKAANNMPTSCYIEYGFIIESLRNIKDQLKTMGIQERDVMNILQPYGKKLMGIFLNHYENTQDLAHQFYEHMFEILDDALDVFDDQGTDNTLCHQIDICVALNFNTYATLLCTKKRFHGTNGSMGAIQCYREAICRLEDLKFENENTKKMYLTVFSINLVNACYQYAVDLAEQGEAGEAKKWFKKASKRLSVVQPMVDKQEQACQKLKDDIELKLQLYGKVSNLTSNHSALFSSAASSSSASQSLQGALKQEEAADEEAPSMPPAPRLGPARLEEVIPSNFDMGQLPAIVLGHLGSHHNTHPTSLFFSATSNLNAGQALQTDLEQGEAAHVGIPMGPARFDQIILSNLGNLAELLEPVLRKENSHHATNTNNDDSDAKDNNMKEQRPANKK